MVGHLDANIICVCMCITTITIKIIPLRIHTKVQATTLSFFIHTYYKSNNLI